MAKRRLFEQLGFTEDSIDLDSWDCPYVGALPKDQQTQFNARKKAVITYITTELTLAEIEHRTGVSTTELYRYVKRCLYILANGQFAGFNALLPYFRLEPYERKTKSGKGYAGKLQQLFSELPELQEYVEKLFLGKPTEDGVREPQMKHYEIHDRFMTKCAVLGIKEDEYPFNTESEARESLRSYLNSLKDKDVRKYVQARYGQDAARRIDATKIDKKMESDRLLWEVREAYQDIQLDEHVINALMIVYVKAPNGLWIPKLCSRIWIIIPIDVITRSILGYHVCITKYNSEDVLMTLAKSISPNWKPLELTIPRLQYKSGAGFPASSVDGCAWKLFDRLSMDNDRCHLSPWVQERINSVIGCTINLGRKRRPETRGIVERFFKTLEERGFNRITSTTGNHINDTRRRHPERDAIEYEIHLNEIEEILDVLCANYNATPHTGCFGVSPLDCLKATMHDNLQLHRTLPEEWRENLPLFDYQFTATIRGNIKKGLRPYIEYLSAHYNNEVLSNMPSLIGSKLTIIANKTDLRVLKAYSKENGKFFGLLRAPPPWNREKHSLRLRRAILKCINDGKIQRGDSDPFRSYHKVLSENALSNRRDRNKLAKFEREVEYIVDTDTENTNLDVSKIQLKTNIIHRRGWIKIT